MQGANFDGISTMASSSNVKTAQTTQTAPVITTRILRRLLASGVHHRVERMLERIHPADLGPLLADLTPDEIRTIIDLLFKHHRAVGMLKELPPELKSRN